MGCRVNWLCCRKRGVDTSSFCEGNDRGGTENAGVGVFSGFVKEEESDLHSSCGTGKRRGLNYVGMGRGRIIVGRLIGDSGL